MTEKAASKSTSHLFEKANALLEEMGGDGYNMEEITQVFQLGLQAVAAELVLRGMPDLAQRVLIATAEALKESCEKNIQARAALEAEG